MPAALFGLGLWDLGLLSLDGHVMLVAGLAGALLGIIDARRILWWACGSLVALMLLISYTPLVPLLAHRLEVKDSLAPAPAVVMLGSSAFQDGTLGTLAQARLLRTCAVLRQGCAASLVLTRPPADEVDWDPTISRLLNELRMGVTVETVGPCRDTHDEALAVAALARKRHWASVILVTHPWHMRRASAAFSRAGLKVYCSSCAEGRFDWNAMNDQGDRIRAFRCWLHEWVGYVVYRWRGWV